MGSLEVGTADVETENGWGWHPDNLRNSSPTANESQGKRAGSGGDKGGVDEGDCGPRWEEPVKGGSKVWFAGGVGALGCIATPLGPIAG
jgi:hypothetical protein